MVQSRCRWGSTVDVEYKYICFKYLKHSGSEFRVNLSLIS